MQNPTKTARQISKTDFYFVTGFYSFVRYLSCDKKTGWFRQEDMIFLDRKTRRHVLFRQEDMNF